VLCSTVLAGGTRGVPHCRVSLSPKVHSNHLVLDIIYSYANDIFLRHARWVRCSPSLRRGAFFEQYKAREFETEEISQRVQTSALRWKECDSCVLTRNSLTRKVPCLTV
jgi:hypothetical protein